MEPVERLCEEDDDDLTDPDDPRDEEEDDDLTLLPDDEEELPAEDERTVGAGAAGRLWGWGREDDDVLLTSELRVAGGVAFLLDDSELRVVDERTVPEVLVLGDGDAGRTAGDELV